MADIEIQYQSLIDNAVSVIGCDKTNDYVIQPETFSNQISDDAIQFKLIL